TSLLTSTATPEIYTLSYTTLFRSTTRATSSSFLKCLRCNYCPSRIRNSIRQNPSKHSPSTRPASRKHCATWPSASTSTSLAAPRSEEHTSELQSRENLVCRLLLEK